MQIETTKAYIFGLAVAALTALSGWLYFVGIPFSWEFAGIAAILTLVCAISRYFPLNFGRAKVDIADVAALATLVILGPIWALLVTLPNILYKDHLRTVFVFACEILVFIFAGYILALFSEPVLIVAEFNRSLVYGAAAAGAVFYTLDALVNSGLAYFKYGSPITETVKESFLPLIPSDLAAILAALGTSYVMISFGPAAALVLFSGAAIALITLHLVNKFQRENEELKSENARLLTSSVSFAAGVVESLGAKDGYTARLAAASSVFAGDLAGEFDLDAERAQKLKVAALLQDVGLISVPDEVLMASRRNLNSVGRMRLERHPVESEEILSNAPGFTEAAKWVRWHHERVDGTGYPDRLKSRWIPLESRILAVCEVYASMVLDAPESPALYPRTARMEITHLSERSLDSEVVKALLRVLDREDANYASAADDRFTFVLPANEAGGDFLPRVVGEEN